MINITKERYIELRQAELTLNALHGGGVDNWDFYSDSLPSDKELENVVAEAEELHEER